MTPIVINDPRTAFARARRSGSSLPLVNQPRKATQTHWDRSPVGSR